MKIIWLPFLFYVLIAQNKEMSALEIIGEIDKNMNASLKFDNNLILINLPNLILEMCNNLNLD